MEKDILKKPMKYYFILPKIIFLTFVLLSSCFSIKSDRQVKKDILEHLRKKYKENFTVMRLSNNTEGHGRGALWATGNDFTIELNTQDPLPTCFDAHVAYDTNNKFIFYGDTYKEEVLTGKMKKDFDEILLEGYPEQTACDIYFQVIVDSLLDKFEVKKINYKEALAQQPYAVSLSSGSVYFFKDISSEKEVTEYLRRYFIKLQQFKLNSLDLFVYYWNEKYIKDKPVDSLKIIFGYESQGTSFESGKYPEKKYRFRFGKEELDHMDTLNLYRYMKDF